LVVDFFVFFELLAEKERKKGEIKENRDHVRNSKTGNAVFAGEKKAEEGVDYNREKGD